MVTPPIRVAIGDDSAPVRAALGSLIDSEERMELVGSVKNADEVAALCASERVDVAIVDVAMPGGGGPAAAEQVRQVSPDTRVIAYSAHSDAGTRELMRRAGAVGFVAKGGRIDELVEAIIAAADDRVG